MSDYLLGLAKSEVDAGRPDSVAVTVGLMAAGADAAEQIADANDRLSMLAAGMDGHVQIIRIGGE